MVPNNTFALGDVHGPLLVVAGLPLQVLYHLLAQGHCVSVVGQHHAAEVLASAAVIEGEFVLGHGQGFSPVGCGGLVNSEQHELRWVRMITAGCRSRDLV
jgi:hypothetical protein